MTRARHGWTLTAIAIAGFMTTLDNTVVNVALPSIQRELHAPLPTLEWVATAYMLSFAGVMLAGGRMADVYGRKRIFLCGLAVFTAASALAGTAPTAATLIAARVAQGAGAALVVPAGLALVTAGRTERERATGTVVWVGSAALALALGPTAGGWLAQHWGWGWIFFINVPPGVLVLVLGARTVAESRDATARGVDLPGMLAATVTLFAAAYALAEAPSHGWRDPLVLGALGPAAAGLVALVAVERRSAHPMIDAAFFRSRVFTGGIAVQVLWGAGLNGALFYLSLHLQEGLGFSPTLTGAVFLPPAVLGAVLTPVSFPACARLGPRATIAGGLAVMAAGLGGLALLRPGDGYLDLLPAVTLIGAGGGLTMPLPVYVLGAVSDDRSGTAGGVFSVAREISGALGIAAIGVVITARERPGTGPAAEHALARAIPAGLLTGAALIGTGALVALATLPRRTRIDRAVTAHSPDARAENADVGRGQAVAQTARATNSPEIPEPS